MKKIISVSIFVLSIILLSINAIASENETTSFYETHDLTNVLALDDNDSNTNQISIQGGTYIYCKCAKWNAGWIGRRVGIGNKKCLANNIGSMCLHGFDVECQSSNPICGGDAPEVNE